MPGGPRLHGWDSWFPLGIQARVTGVNAAFSLSMVFESPWWGMCWGNPPPAKAPAAVGKCWCILAGTVLWETGLGMSAPLCVLTEVTSDGHFHWVFTMGRVLLPRPLGLACDGVNPLSPTNGQLTHR